MPKNSFKSEIEFLLLDSLKTHGYWVDWWKCSILEISDFTNLSFSVSLSIEINHIYSYKNHDLSLEINHTKRTVKTTYAARKRSIFKCRFYIKSGLSILKMSQTWLFCSPLFWNKSYMHDSTDLNTNLSISLNTIL